MIRGRVNSHGEPVVSIVLLSGKRRLVRKAIVDTGFNGYLSVPDTMTGQWYFFGYEKYEIATGEVVEQKVYIGRIIWDSTPQDVYVVTSQSKDILIGTRLLKHHRLVIDFSRKHVTVNRVGQSHS